MKIIKKILLWILAIFLFMGALGGLIMKAPLASVGLVGLGVLSIPKKSNESNQGKSKKAIRTVFALVFVVITFVGLINMPEEDKSETTQNNTASTTKKPVEATPEIELKDEYEKGIWKIVHDSGGKMTGIDQNTTAEDGTVYVSVIASVKNDGKSVDKVVKSVQQLTAEKGINKGIHFSFSDIDEKNANVLATRAYDAQGKLLSYHDNANYKSDYTNWLNKFLNSDGSSNYLNDLIVPQLKDGYSYDVEQNGTGAKQIENQDDINQMTTMLQQANATNISVQLGDVYMTTTFSAKNSFNARVQSTAYALARYSSSEPSSSDIYWLIIQ